MSAAAQRDGAAWGAGGGDDMATGTITVTVTEIDEMAEVLESARDVYLWICAEGELHAWDPPFTRLMTILDRLSELQHGSQEQAHDRNETAP